MAQFLFRLEAVLRHRKNLEEQKQREIAAEETKVRALQEKLAGLEQGLREANEQLRRNELIGPINLANLTGHRRFVANTQKLGLTIVQTIGVRRQIIATLKESLAVLAKERKVIEKLRERQYEVWRQARLLKEAAENDEIGTNIAIANSIEMECEAALTAIESIVI